MTKEKFLKSFIKQRPVYDKYTTLIKDTLKSLLKEHGFKPQRLFPRTKTSTSLTKNLNKKGRYRSLSRIYDLSGCRVVFYLEKDIELFAPILGNSFTIVEQQLKYSTNNYNARHIVIKLNNKTASLKKYSKFRNYTCEVQLTTVLDHAWSELNHDIAYKIPEELRNFDKTSIELISKGFNKVMENHILPANQEFSFIVQKFEELKENQKIFKSNFLNKLTKSKSNNEIYELLEKLNEGIRRFGDKTPKSHSINNIIDSVIKRASQNSPEPKNNPFGGVLPPVTLQIICIKLLEIIDQLKYWHSKKFFSKLIDFSNNENPETQKKALEILSDLSKFDPKVLDKAGLHFQYFTLNKIEAWTNISLKRNQSAVLSIADQLLQPSASGESMSGPKTFQFSFPPLNPTKEIKDIRLRTLKILERLYYLTSSDKVKTDIINILESSSHSPQTGRSYKMKQMLLSNSKTTISMYLNFLKSANLPTISKIEENTHRILTRFPKNEFPKLKQYKAPFRNNYEYNLYKIFVGYDFRFVKDLGEQKEGNYKIAEEHRRKRIAKLVERMSTANFNTWQMRILRFAIFYSQAEDKGEFRYFLEFLFLIAKEKPMIAKLLWENNPKELEPFLLNLLQGLKESSNYKLFRATILEWIAQPNRLLVCAQAFEWHPPLDYLLMENIYLEAIKQKDANALSSLTLAIGRNYDNSKKQKVLFIKSIKELTKYKRTDWLSSLSMGEKSIFHKLNQNDNKIILNNLIYCSHLHHYDERVLAYIANSHPDEVISFFVKRMTLYSKIKRPSQYDSVPFNLHELGSALKIKKRIIIPLILKIFSKRGRNYQREAANLMKAIFPTFDKYLESKLIELVKTRRKANFDIAYEILRPYKGKPFIHKVCREMVKQFGARGKFNSKVMVVLSQTGVVSGEYGMSNAYERKLIEIQSWKKSHFKIIRDFASEFETVLKQDVAFHKKLADRDVKGREKDFNWGRE